jgi:chromosome segregation ATPase
MKKDGNYFLPNNKLIQETQGNEENWYPDSDNNKTKINYTKEPNKAQKNTLKKEFLQVINESFIEMILDMVIQIVQEALKKFQDNKNNEYEKVQEQIKETTEALNKWQNEAKDTINREINELRLKIDNIKEEVTHDMENLRKKETEIQNTMEGHSSRLEQAEERIWELENVMESKGKNQRSITQTTENLWKEYARTHILYQKPKPENHGHWRRRGISKRNL